MVSKKIYLNDWDQDQLKKYGYVEYGEFVVMTKEAYSLLRGVKHSSL